MTTFIHIDKAIFTTLTQHLVSSDQDNEHAAFLFATSQVRSSTTFDVIAIHTVSRTELIIQGAEHLSLADEILGSLIKRAHDLNCSLIEVHSHLGPWPARFSLFDRTELRQIVPYMWWRLNGRPYFAIVMSHSGFDALVWLYNPGIPAALDGLVVGDTLLKPTNNSLEGW